MNGPRPFDRAYGSLREYLISGRFEPGQRLEAKQLAALLDVSTSPIREAFSALAAQGLLHFSKGNGFSIPAFDIVAVTDLLRLHEYLSILAGRIAGQSQTAMGMPTGALDHATRTVRFFRTLGYASGNSEIGRSLGNANDRLHHIRREEARLLNDVAGELSDLEASLSAGSRDLVRRLHIYHQRRIAIIPNIARLIESKVHDSD